MTTTLCSRHPARPAEGHCGSCGRPVCLECAVPFRGHLRCPDCAAREVGEAAADDGAEEATGPSGAGRAAGLSFAGGVLASLLPWDRVGTRTGFLSGWNPQPEPWPLMAAVLLLIGAVAALRPAPDRASLRVGLTPVVLGGLAVISALLSLLPPDLTVRGPVPLVVLASAVAGTVLSAIGLRASDAAPRA